MQALSWSRFIPSFLLSQAARSGSFQKNILKLGAGTAVGQLLVVAVTPIITRLYGPTEIGLAGLFIGFVSFISVAAALRYDLAIVDAKNERDSKVLLLGSFLAAIPVSALAAGIYLLMIRERILSYDQLPPWSASLVFVVVLLSGLFMSCRLWYTRSNNFQEISRSLIRQGVGRAFLPILVAPLHLSWIALIMGELVGRSMGLSRMVMHTTSVLRGFIATSGSTEIAQVLKGYWRYPAIMLPSALIDSLQSFLPLPVVSALFGTVAAGQFVLVMRVSSLPAGLIAASVSDVYHSRIAAAFRDNPATVPGIFKEVVIYLAKISAIVYAPVILLSPFVFGILFGHRWSEAGIVNACIAPSAAVLLVTNPLTRTLNALGYQSWKIRFDIPRVAFPLIAIWAAHNSHWSFAGSMAAFAAVSICLDLILVNVIWRAIGAATRHHESGLVEVSP